MRRQRAWALVAAVLLLVACVPLVLGNGSRIAAFLVDPFAAPPLPAPPIARLDTPSPGEGVARNVTLVGEARADASRVVADVQLRVDGGRWASLPDAPRGEPVSAFRATVELAPGDHLLEVRAWDGQAFSLPARALVRSGDLAPPTVRIASPTDGAGLPEGTTLVSGSAPGAVRVLVRDGDATWPADVVAGAWNVAIPLSAGIHRLEAQAAAPAGWSLPTVATVAVGDVPPPSLAILAPQDGDAFGSAGDPLCATACVLVRGVASPTAARVVAALDGGAPRNATLAGGAWQWRVAIEDLFAGPHVASFYPVDDAGRVGVAQDVTFQVRAARARAVSGDDAPRPTGTPLAFWLAGADNATAATWSLDGAPIAEGPEAHALLAKPGAHALRVEARDARGRPASVEIPLVALNRPPIAALHALAGLAVSDTPFRADARDDDGSVIRYAWEFGDGTRAETTSASTTHRYASEGVYRANLTVYDDQGAPSPAATLLVAIANAPPTALMRVAPEHPTLLDDVVFTDASFDPEGRLASRTWDFGDGASSAAPMVAHRFATRGDHVVSLTVTDALGAAAVAQARIQVENVPPEPAFSWSPLAPHAGEEVAFVDASRKPDGQILNWSWSFGGSGPGATTTFATPGAHDVTLTLTDDWGARVSLTRTLVVGDAAPRIRALSATPAQPLGRQEVRFQALGNDAMGGLVAYAWAFGDGNVSAEPAPMHAFARSGDYTVSLVAHNAAGVEARANVTLRVGNAPPTARLAPAKGLVGWPVTLADAGSADPDGTIRIWRFDADGDGVPECDGPEPRCEFAYPAAGVYAANLTVIDDEGATASTTLAVVVEVPPPSLAPPRLAITKPASDATLRGQVLVLGTASGNRTLRLVELQLRNATRSYALGPQAWMGATGTRDWQLLLDTAAFPDGEYRLVARVTDTAGAQGATSLPIRIRNGAAETALVVRVANAPVEPVGPDYDLEGSAYHPLGVTAVRWRVDDGPWRDAAPPLAFTLPLRGLAPGLHVVLVDAYHGVEEKRELRVELSVALPPPALLVDEPPGPLAYGLLHAAGRVTGSGGVQWRLDNGPWQPVNLTAHEWRLDVETRDVPAGHHELALRPVGSGGAPGEAQSWSVRVVRAFGDTRFAGYGIDGQPPTPVHETPWGVLAPILALLLASRHSRRRL